MSALERLRAREIFGQVAQDEPTEPTKGASVGFVGTPGDASPKYSTPANDESDPECDGYGLARQVDPEVERRRAKALAILAEQPDRQAAVVAEAGDPAHVTVAIRGVAAGELTIPAERYDAFALLGLMNEYGHA